MTNLAHAEPWTATLNEMDTIMFEEFDKLATLKSNWDTYGGLPVSQNVISIARDFLNEHFSEFKKHPRIIPSCNGGVQIEGLLKSNLEIELEFKQDMTLECLFINGNDIKEKHYLSYKDFKFNGL